MPYLFFAVFSCLIFAIGTSTAHAQTPQTPNPSSFSCKRMALTFDDGPVLGKTQDILDVLSYYDVKATFFMLGKNVRAYPQIVQEVVFQGHDLGLHGDGHLDLTKVSLRVAEEDLKKGAESLMQYQNPLLYWRAPYGSVPSGLSYPSTNHIRHVGWSIDSLDWKRRGVLEEVRQVVSGFHDGAIVLFHDHVAFTPQALALIIEEATRQGYLLGGVSSLREECQEELYFADINVEQNQQQPQNPNFIYVEPLEH